MAALVCRPPKPNTFFHGGRNTCAGCLKTPVAVAFYPRWKFALDRFIDRARAGPISPIGRTTDPTRFDHLKSTVCPKCTEDGNNRGRRCACTGPVFGGRGTGVAAEVPNCPRDAR